MGLIYTLILIAIAALMSTTIDGLLHIGGITQGLPGWLFWAVVLSLVAWLMAPSRSRP
ncbi:MAG: hypothetical protein IGR92_07410 [Leptolyngbyaceae cyanobacterium T60_A2020_046]|nr:hypothetical protein [Leptolyngbyaceae cyanobacterium T60_A2020_046]